MTGRRAARLLLCLCLAISLSGCAGEMKGVVRGEGTPIRFGYEQGIDRDFYSVTLDGETFTGQAVDAGATSGFGTVFSGSSVTMVPTFSSSGNFVAVLFGDMGSTMRCRMNYVDTSGFTTMGGVGICEVSDGRIIDVSW